MKIVKVLFTTLFIIVFIITLLLSIYFLTHGGAEVIQSAIKEYGFFDAILEFFKKLFTKIA